MSEEEHAWSEAADDLKMEISEWADHKTSRQKKWILELSQQDIDSFRTLEQWAEDDNSFSALCAAVSISLRVKLLSWFKQKYTDRILPSAPKQAKPSLPIYQVSDRFQNLLTVLQSELQVTLPIRPIEKFFDNLLPDNIIGTPQRVFVNREAEIELALKTFYDSHRSIDKVSLLVCSQMFGQGKTRFGRELTNPLLYSKFCKDPQIIKYQTTIDRLCAAEYVRIDVSRVIRYLKPDQFGMNLWIRIGIIGSIFEMRGIPMDELVDFCKRNIENVTSIGNYLLNSLNRNVFLHFDELDALVFFANDYESDDERVARFYEFWNEIRTFLHCKYFIFCTARQAWFQKVGKGKGPYQSPSGLTRIVLRALSKSKIEELLSRSPAEDETLRAENKTVLDELKLYDDETLSAVSEEIERFSGGIPRLIDYSIHSLCLSSKQERITMESIPKLFAKGSILEKMLRNSADVKIMLEQLESKNNHPFFALLIWLGYTETAVDLTLQVNFFGHIMLSISELADFCCMYFARVDGTNVLIKLPQCFRDTIENTRGSPLGEAFPLVKTGSQWKTLENLVQCFLWSLMKMSQISSQSITLGVVCSALIPTHAGELHFDSDAKWNRVIQDIGKITKNNAKSRYAYMMNQIQKGDSVIVSFFEKSHSPDHLLIFNKDVIILVGIQDKLCRSKNWATEKLLEDEVHKFVLCCTHCEAQKSVFVLLAPFLDGQLKDYDGQVLTTANYEFIPCNMHVIVLSLRTGAASFLFSDSFVVELIESVDIA